MVVVAVVLVIGIGFAIAAWFVVREAGRLTTEPPPVVFSLDEAYEWVVEELPDEVAATLTPGDVRRILTFQVEYFDRSGIAPKTRGGGGGGTSSGGNDRVERGVLGPSEGAVATTNLDIGIAELGEPLAGDVGELRDAFDREHALRDEREHGRGISRARADLEHGLVAA